MRLAELQRLVLAVVRGEAALAASAEALGVAPERLGLYRELVAGHVPATLGRTHAHTRAAVGPAWSALATTFCRECPPREPELHAAIAPFPEWLAERGAALGLGARAGPLAALAVLEREVFAAFVHPADVPDRDPRLAALTSAPDDPDALAPNPTLAVFETEHAVVSWLAAHPRPGDVTPATPLPEPLPSPGLALVFRRGRRAPTPHAVAFHAATARHLFALKAVAERVPLAEAARLAGVELDVARAAIAEAVAIGLLT